MYVLCVLNDDDKLTIHSNLGLYEIKLIRTNSLKFFSFENENT